MEAGFIVREAHLSEHGDTAEGNNRQHGREKTLPPHGAVNQARERDRCQDGDKTKPCAPI